MTIDIDAQAVQERLKPMLDDPGFQTALANLASDPFFLAFFLVSVSQGEGLGAAAVGMIGDDELAQRIRNLHQHESEERSHEQSTLQLARELFPEFFDGERYRHEGALEGQRYYLAVLEENRAYLENQGCFSRLNQYLTTTFGYEIMVILLYQAVADAVAASPLTDPLRSRIGAVLGGILDEEEGHVSVIQEHDFLLTIPRIDLTSDGNTMLDSLVKLGPADYFYCADLAVRRVVEMMRKYEDSDRYRAQIESGIAPSA